MLKNVMSVCVCVCVFDRPHSWRIFVAYFFFLFWFACFCVFLCKKKYFRIKTTNTETFTCIHARSRMRISCSIGKAAYELKKRKKTDYLVHQNRKSQFGLMEFTRRTHCLSCSSCKRINQFSLNVVSFFSLSSKQYRVCCPLQAN